MLVLSIFVYKYQGISQEKSTINEEVDYLVNARSSTNVTLRQLAQKSQMKIGTSVLIEPLRKDAKYREVLAREFNTLTPENAMKFGKLSQERGNYNFADADDIVAFAQDHQMQVHGHTLVWYRNLPNWFKDRQFSRQELMDILQKHIYTVVGRYQGKVNSWDVVNEAVNKDGSFRDSIWLKTIGSEYIEMAFRWAHEANPNARLFYNDFEAEDLGKKSDTIYNLVKELRRKNVPIHGVGFQMHTSIKKPPNYAEVAANIRRLNELKLEVKITEMDVKIHNQPVAVTLAEQAKVYENITRICLAAPNCNTLTTWGLSDRFSWIPIFYKSPDAPLLFDQNYQPKPAYYAVAKIVAR
ncbi:endo-1,4-beta-xylanase [Phormidium sp. LEGE 05292]|uniref:endo-1,4-beta-xylanase n=1 Tax=[Phormidium] sp. LEGE 05292 TaxID=767427 RepID=UPI00188124FF|nr:endo-1,4-beta-xylanase [Phormidium sp. LEGE 05292]MBE9226053.1 endo-1,4-beta-xylanase [Phormidium sp. LEGE 05292]